MIPSAAWFPVSLKETAEPSAMWRSLESMLVSHACLSGGSALFSETTPREELPVGGI
jgi:hypothetical protein